jgi:RsiW-degrading membrane proteinase PrsW (M82 family)
MKKMELLHFEVRKTYSKSQRKFDEKRNLYFIHNLYNSVAKKRKPLIVLISVFFFTKCNSTILVHFPCIFIFQLFLLFSQIERKRKQGPYEILLEGNLLQGELGPKKWLKENEQYLKRIIH